MTGEIGGLRICEFNYNLVFLRIFVSSCQLFKTTFVRSLELHVFITVEDGVFLLLLFIMIICNVSLHMTILWEKAPAEEEEELELLTGVWLVP